MDDIIHTVKIKLCHVYFFIVWFFVIAIWPCTVILNCQKHTVAKEEWSKGLLQHREWHSIQCYYSTNNKSHVVWHWWMHCYPLGRKSRFPVQVKCAFEKEMTPRVLWNTATMSLQTMEGSSTGEDNGLQIAQFWNRKGNR